MEDNKTIESEVKRGRPVKTDESLEDFLQRMAVHEVTKEVMFTTPNIFKSLMGQRYTGNELYFHYKDVIVGLKGKEVEVSAELKKDFNRAENERFGQHWIS